MPSRTISAAHVQLLQESDMNNSISDLKIHVLDDEPFILNLISRLLDKLGVASVDKSTSARETLKSLELAPEGCDVIIADLNMPEVDGIEFIRHLAEIQFSGALIILSGEDLRVLESARHLADRHQLRVAGILQKPVNISVLESMLETIPTQQAYKRPQRQGYQKIDADEMIRALEEDELLLHYQPKVRLGTGSCDSVEALVRWQHPTHGLLPPISFVDHIEQGPLAAQITERIYAMALEQHLDWYAAGHPLRMSVNLPVMILDDVSFANMLVEMADKAGVERCHVCFEITETGVIENLNAAAEILTRLRMKGFGVAIDDFGTGHSSLSQLKEIPFTELKIDRSFVSGTTSNESWIAITESSVSLAKKLGMSVVAEGVETTGELDFVKTLGCEYGQGYLFSKPMHPVDFSVWMKTADFSEPSQVA
jgi:EAL domain-containing protein (putative c-di-GMP-specific phosphodiesterase class I)/DNA-binding NarL/FixJ family response regulator